MEGIRNNTCRYFKTCALEYCYLDIECPDYEELDQNEEDDDYEYDNSSDDTQEIPHLSFE